MVCSLKAERHRIARRLPRAPGMKVRVIGASSLSTSPQKKTKKNIPSLGLQLPSKKILKLLKTPQLRTFLVLVFGALGTIIPSKARRLSNLGFA